VFFVIFILFSIAFLKSCPHRIMARKFSPNDHIAILKYALELASQSPPKDTNFRVGAVLLDLATNTVTSTGYTLELPGNTHAEQCALSKLATYHGVQECELSTVKLGAHALYTTMEPCVKRLSGNLPCVERVLEQHTWIRQVYVGVVEPATFVGGNDGRARLEAAGVEVVHIPGMEREILTIATAGHNKETK
jgi:pyrimidine deaminase RibD-like protein